MKIETKFDIGQQIFYISSAYKNIQLGFISKILVTQYNVWYGLSHSNYAYRETELFITKEEAEQKLKELKK